MKDSNFSNEKPVCQLTQSEHFAGEKMPQQREMDINLEAETASLVYACGCRFNFTGVRATMRKDGNGYHGGGNGAGYERGQGNG